MDAVGGINPGIIIHAAAQSSPNECEKNESNAYAVNTEGTNNILDAAKRTKSRVVFVSTDLVFDGAGGYYRESDAACPISVYGRTKREAESLCMSGQCDSVVVRISLQYGNGQGHARSFADWMLDRFEKNVTVPLFIDEYRSPCYLVDTAYGIVQAAYRARAGEILHLGGPERIDRYSFGRIVSAVYGYPEKLLQKVTRADMNEGAPRPRDVSLDIQKFVNTFSFRPRSVFDGIQEMFKTVKSSR
jgi:dTDP-4-dehydrorhamnose reductase